MRPLALALLVLLCAALGACRTREAPPRQQAPEPPPSGTLYPLAPLTPAPSDEPPFDPDPIVFDTTEPPSPVVEIPAPLPPPLPPPPPPAGGIAGGCDVREAEQFCFTYTGPAWTRESARAHCADAPTSTFRPEACPVEGRIATCVFRRSDTPTREIVYTYYAPYDLGLARLACPGEFTAH